MASNNFNNDFDDGLEGLLDKVKTYYFLEVPFFESVFSLTSGILLGLYSPPLEVKNFLEYAPIILYAFAGYNDKIIVKKEKEEVVLDDIREEVLVEAKSSFLEKILGSGLGVVYSFTFQFLGYNIGYLIKNYF